MKKILMLAALPLIILLFGFTSKASTITVTKEEVKSAIDDYFSVDYSFTDGFVNALNTVLNDSSKANWYFYLVNYPGSSELYLRMNSSRASTSGNNWVLGSAANYINNTQNDNNIHSGSSSQFSKANTKEFVSLEELQEFFFSVDWTTIYYNPQIPVPKLNVWYLYQVESFREDGIANFSANIDVPDSTEFYIELAWKYSYPQSIRVYSSDVKGTPAYDYELYQSSDLISIYSLQDMQSSINLHVTGSSLQTAWQAAYDSFIDGVTFYTNQSNAPANWLSTARLKYVNKMATQIPLYGNRLEVFARYWTLSEDNKVVVGKWYHWQSAKGSATEDIPENYVNYQELPGYAGTVENVPSDNENTYTGTGENTGEQATTVINYAPNYPDYPTAVSYNHDNILLQMIQTSKQLPQFFGQFTNFLAITLAFIDPGVWAIIGFGFTCCIVIMIIKVL